MSDIMYGVIRMTAIDVKIEYHAHQILRVSISGRLDGAMAC